MALYPEKFTGQDRLQPGGRGEVFQVDMPGYRDGADRVNRTNMKLNTNAHDVPNIKYEFDRRLPVIFKYGYAYGFNQVVIPKGRLVAVDPYLNHTDFESRHDFNVLTMANGGNMVSLKTSGALSGKEWEPVADPTAYLVDTKTGKLKDRATSAIVENVRPGNQPLGIMQRNEYTRYDDAFNGIMPGAVLTDAMVELPWFSEQAKAEGNPWGSAYGDIRPGMLVKSDANGRFVPSPLNNPAFFNFAEDEVTETTTAAELAALFVAKQKEIEAERQQVVGQIYSTDHNLIPEGAAKWATWALSERMNFNEFNPDVYRQNNRTGEDSINNSPHNSNGGYPGYPFDRAIGDNDLHMLGATLRNVSNRMDPRYVYENLGIPGLTDGVNAVTREIGPETVGQIRYAGGTAYVDMFFRASEVNIEATTLQISVGDAAYANCTVGAALTVGFTPAGAEATAEEIAAHTFLSVKYADVLQGVVVLEVTDKTKADTYLNGKASGVNVKFKYRKRGMAGVPTFLDWDGCVGSVKILLQK